MRAGPGILTECCTLARARWGVIWANLAAIVCAAGVQAQEQEFDTFKGHGGPVMGLSVSVDGQVASASFDNSVGVWTQGVPLWLEGHDAAVVDLLFLGPDRLVSGGDDFAVWLWSGVGSAAGAEGRRLGRHKGKVTDLDVSPDGTRVASASWDGSVRLWDVTGQGDAGAAEHVLDQRNAGFSDVVFAPDGQRLFAATSGGDIVAYDLTGARPPRFLVRHGFGINELIADPQGRWLAYGAVDGGTRVIDPETAAPLHDFTLDRRPILAMDYNADTGQLAVGDGHGYIMMIDTQTWRIARDFRAVRAGPIWALAFSPDGQTIYAGGLDDVIYAWPVALMDRFEPVDVAGRSFLREADSMSNGERQFMRKCSICHALTGSGARKAGPTLHGVFGRRAGALPGYRYSQVLRTADIIWSEETINALFDEGPDVFIPDSKMPMQRIVKPQDRMDLIEFLRRETAQ